MGRDADIESCLKSWLDTVIVPALVRQFENELKVRGSSAEPSDNNPLVTNANKRKEVQP
jgi:hypothetical protein